MKSNKIKIFALVVFLVIASVVIGITVNRLQQEPLLPAESSPTLESPLYSTATLSNTLAPPTASAFEIFFGDASCSWPCWQGITPGVTRSSDALQLLQASPLVSKSTLQTEGSGPENGDARWYSEISEQFLGFMEWQDGVVSLIHLDAYVELSIGEIINKFGPPEKVYFDNCAEIPESPPQWCACLYYPKKGFEIMLEWEMIEYKYVDYVQFSPSDPIHSVHLFEPSTLEDWLSYGGINYPPITDLQDWKGYGYIRELYGR